jgi:hypothetical protein
MNFGASFPGAVFFALVLYAIPIALLIWFIVTLTSMASSLRDLANRLASVERALRENRNGPLDRH